jgi:hypothetical protein
VLSPDIAIPGVGVPHCEGAVFGPSSVANRTVQRSLLLVLWVKTTPFLNRPSQTEIAAKLGGASRNPFARPV